MEFKHLQLEGKVLQVPPVPQCLKEDTHDDHTFAFKMHI